MLSKDSTSYGTYSPSISSGGSTFRINGKSSVSGVTTPDTEDFPFILKVDVGFHQQ